MKLKPISLLDGKASQECWERPSGENSKTISGTKKITMWIQWSDEDGAFIGYCPQFFPYGVVCHGHTEAKTVTKLARLVRPELGERGELPHRLAKQRKGQASR